MFEKVKMLIAEELGTNADELTMETDFFNDLHCDSLELIELVNTVEEEFELEEIPEEALAEFKTIGALVKYLEENVTE